MVLYRQQEPQRMLSAMYKQALGIVQGNHRRKIAGQHTLGRGDEPWLLLQSCEEGENPSKVITLDLIKLVMVSGM